MSTSKTLFFEQQKTAFYAHNFDKMTYADLEKAVFPFKPLKTYEFPCPLAIFTKKFAFLPAPLKAMQQKKSPEMKPSPNSMKPQSTKIMSPPTNSTPIP